MSEQQKQTIEEFEYRAEMQQLLHLIVHSLYLSLIHISEPTRPY